MLYFLFKDCVLYGRKWRLISSSIVVILLVMFISIDIDLIFYDLYENSKLVIFRKNSILFIFNFNVIWLNCF